MALFLRDNGATTGAITLAVEHALSGTIAGAGSFAAAELEVTHPPAYAEFETLLEVDEFEALLEVEDYVALLTIDKPFGGDMYVTKVGDRLPGISGTVTVPAAVDLTDAVFWLTMKGRDTDTLLRFEVDNDGLQEDSPAVGNEAGSPTIWKWSHTPWAVGETATADRYSVGIAADVNGLQMTLPNGDWSEFVIRAQLSGDPVP